MAVSHEDSDEQVPDPRRPHRPRGLGRRCCAGALATGGQLPNFLGVLAGSPAALRAYARFRSELRHGKLTLPTLERIALAVAEHYHSEPGIAMHSRTARAAGLALDEVALARQFNSKDQREAALLRYLQALLEEGGRAADAPARGGARGRLGRRADPGGDRGRRAGGVHRDGQRRRRGPVDGSTEASRALQAA